MKRKIVTGVLLGSAGLFSLKKIFHDQFSRPKTMVVVADPLLSDNFKKYLNLSFHEQQKVAGRVDTFINYLKERYPVFKTVTSTDNQKSVTIKMVADRPSVSINGNFCLTDLGKLVPASHYQKAVIAQLPALTVIQDDNTKLILSEACLRFIKKLNKQVLQEYSLTWHDENTITLQDKHDRYNFLVTSHAQLDQHFFQTIQAIKNENRVPPKRYCSVDMRFKNQIIVKNNRGQWG